MVKAMRLNRQSVDRGATARMRKLQTDFHRHRNKEHHYQRTSTSVCGINVARYPCTWLDSRYATEKLPPLSLALALEQPTEQ